MNTIPATLTWEYLARNRWTLALPFLIAVATALLVLLPLKSLDFSPDARELVGLQLVLLWALLLIVILGVFESQGSLKPLYTKPVSTTGLVSYFFWGGALLVAAEVALLIFLCRWRLGSTWPFAGPMLFAVVFWGWTQVLFRVSMRTYLWVPATLVIFAALLFWSMYRHGAAFKEGGMIDPSVHYWATLTGLDILIAIASLVLTFSLTAWRVTCDRSGRPAWPALGHARTHWPTIKLESSQPLKTFVSGQNAHEWFDFQNRNVSLPRLVLAELLLFWFIALVFYPFYGNLRVSWQVAFSGTLFVVITQFVAALFVHLSAMKGHSVQDYQGAGREQRRRKPVPFGISQFLTALPISTRQIASAMLRSSARAAGGAAILILASFVMLGGLSWIAGDDVGHPSDSKFNFWKFPFAMTACSMLLTFIVLNLTCLYSPRQVSWEHWVSPTSLLLCMLTLWSPAFPFVSCSVAAVALVGLVFATSKSLKLGDVSASNASLLWLAGAATTVGLACCLPPDARLFGGVLIATLVMLALLPIFSTAAALRLLRTG
ncbi:MAG: hypothetical protein ACK55S_07840 [Planctomycetota bacterium]